VGKNRLAFRFVCAFLIVISAVIPVSSADTEEKTALPDQAGPVPQGPISLKEAIDIADAGNLDLAMASHRIERAAASIKKAEAAFYPLVGLSLGYMQGDAPSQLTSESLNRELTLTTPGGSKTGKPAVLWT